MKTLIDTLKKKILTNRKGRTSPLPDEIGALLAEKTFARVQHHIQALLSASPNAPEFESIRASAIDLGWPELQVAKLDAFGNYYRGRLDLAFELARQYSGQTPGYEFDPDLFIISVLCVFHNNQYEDAYRLLASVDSDHPKLTGQIDYYNVRATVCVACGYLAEAKTWIDLARQLDANDSQTAFNAYVLYFELGEADAFNQLRREIQTGKYGDNGNSFALAIPELAQNNYREGFALLERRYRQADANRHVNPGLSAERLWQGKVSEFPQGKHLLVTFEQGLGDSVMMARYLPLLAKATAEKLTLEVQPEALTLLHDNFPKIAMLPRQHGKAPATPYDFWIGSMSLPYAFDSMPESIPTPNGYLHPSPDSALYWREHVAELTNTPPLPKVGIAWSGSPFHKNDRRRSIRFDAIAAYLKQRPDICFFSLQTTMSAGAPDNLIDTSEELVTLSDTAALIAEMDLVITVDTSVVHLAGALGKPTWLLLPCRYEWRWGITGEHNNWYTSVRVLRQATHGDWESLLNHVFGTLLPRHFAKQSRVKRV